MTDPFANFIRTLLACKSRLLTLAHKYDGRVTQFAVTSPMNLYDAGTQANKKRLSMDGIRLTEALALTPAAVAYTVSPPHCVPSESTRCQPNPQSCAPA